MAIASQVGSSKVKVDAVHMHQLLADHDRRADSDREHLEPSGPDHQSSENGVERRTEDAEQRAAQKEVEAAGESELPDEEAVVAGHAGGARVHPGQGHHRDTATDPTDEQTEQHTSGRDRCKPPRGGGDSGPPARGWCSRRDCHGPPPVTPAAVRRRPGKGPPSLAAARGSVGETREGSGRRHAPPAVCGGALSFIAYGPHMTARDGSAISWLLEESRRGLERVDPAELESVLAAGALVVDIRPIEQRTRDGELPGAVVIDRSVLEWRLDPTSPHRLPLSDDPDRRIVVVCSQGYSSSLAAHTLQRLGLSNATDLSGGYQAWLAGRHG